MKLHERLAAGARVVLPGLFLLGLAAPAAASRLPANVRLLPDAAMRPPARAGLPGVAPQVSFGTVLSPTITVGNPGSVPQISFSYVTDSAGLNGVQFTFTSPDGAVSNTMFYFAGAYTHAGTVTFSGSASAPFYSQPGSWKLTQIAISDLGGGYTQYGPQQIAQIFKNTAYTLVNDGPVDTTPPVVVSGQVLTPTVSLSAPDPQFVAHMTGTDNLSGLEVAYVYIQAPGAPFSVTTTSFFPYPLLAAGVDAVVPIYPGSATGTYTISGYEMCDVAGNCFSDQTPADIQKLFGTTSFSVTS